MDNPISSRKTYLIQKDFQVKFILKFCLLVLAGIALSTGLLFLFSQDTLTSSFQDSRLVVENTAEAILPTIITIGLITLSLVTIATIFVTLFISHKIAGPLFRFEQELKEIGQGNLKNRIKLRKKDQTTALAECINDMTAGLHEKVSRILTELERILESAPNKNIPPDVIEELEHLRREITDNLKI